MNERKSLVHHYIGKLNKVADICAVNKGKKIIVFNQYNDVSQRLYWLLLDTGLRPAIINSTVPKKKQAIRMQQFKDGTVDVVLASMSLDEGMNIPAINVGIILSGNSTKRQMVQRVGRVLRKKQDGSIVKLYQIFVRNTMEEKQAIRRTFFLKKLASKTFDEVY